jgi:hypothetical protein
VTEALAPSSPPRDRKKMAARAFVALGGRWNAAALPQLGELQKWFK